ncbi:MAG: GNAT family N-acetyltransferase [Candidatus Woesebacteria bacterium]|jgi:predicted GNAT family acetyltransferase
MKKNKAKYHLSHYQFFDANVLHSIPNTLKTIIAKQMVNLLKEHQETMLQPSMTELIENLNTGQVVISWDTENNAVAGFGRASLWPGKNKKKQKVYEFGSWLVQKEYQGQGIGRKVLYLMIDYLKRENKKLQIIAVCSESNPRPVQVLQLAGAQLTSQPSNVKVLLGEGEAKVVFLDLTNIDAKSVADLPKKMIEKFQKQLYSPTYGNGCVHL